MTITRSSVLVALCVSIGVHAACAKRPPQARTIFPPAADAAPPSPPAPPPEAPPASEERALTEEERFARKSLAELNAERPLGDAWFDVDSMAIRSDARTTLQQHAEWLRKWPSTRVAIEGHCDERGSGEYNLALGERRAAAVRDYLASLGVDRARFDVISKGKEAPVCAGQDEACWQQNRRAHFVFTAK